MRLTDISSPSLTADIWPSTSLETWQFDPEEAFLRWLAEQRIRGEQFRKSSRLTYTCMFSQWLHFLSERRMTILEATAVEAEAFFAGKDIELVSRRRYLQLLDRVYAHLASIGRPGQNPLQEELRKERELDALLPPGLSVPDIEKLTCYLEPLSGWKGARDRAVAALLLGAGLRTNELINLKLEDIEPGYAIDVKPLGVHRRHKTLVLPDDPWRRWLDAWLALRQEKGMQGSYVTPSTASGKLYSPSGVFRRVKEWLVDNGIESDQQGPNLLRNTFARTVLMSGRYSLEQLQEFLGHEEKRATAKHAAALSPS